MNAYKKIKTGVGISGVFVLICAAFPWFTVQCGTVPILTQTGYEAATGKASMAPELETFIQTMESKGVKSDKKDKGDPDPPVSMGALIGLLFCGLATLIGFFGSRGVGKRALFVAAVAAVGLSWAAIEGFPLEKDGKPLQEAQEDQQQPIWVERTGSLWFALLAVWGQAGLAWMMVREERKGGGTQAPPTGEVAAEGAGEKADTDAGDEAQEETAHEANHEAPEEIAHDIGDEASDESGET